MKPIVFYSLITMMVLAWSVAPSALAQNGAGGRAVLPDAQPVIEPPEPQPVASPGLTDLSAKMWADPEFQRQFVESYKSTTAIEPTLTEPEKRVLQEVMKLMQPPAKDPDDEGEQPQRDLDAAAAMLRQNMNRDTSAVFDFMLANIAFEQERFDQAVQYYESAVRKHSQYRRAWKNLALIYVREQEFEKAANALRRVIQLGGADKVSYGLLAYANSNLGHDIAAESAYRMAILFDPESRDWKMGLARSFFRQQRYNEVVALMGQMIEQDPDNAQLWLLQANAYIGLGKAKEAAENYEIVDRLGASSAASLTTLGDIYINNELYGLAVDAYRRAMAREDVSEPDRFVRAAKVLAARTAYEETAELITAVQAQFGEQLSTETQKDLLKLEARIAVAEGKADQEAEVLKEIVALDPLDGEALILLGQHAARTGEIDQAIFHFERAASIEGHEADAKVRHAQMLVKEGRFEDALPLLRAAQQIKPRTNVQEYLDQVERIARSR